MCGRYVDTQPSLAAGLQYVPAPWNASLSLEVFEPPSGVQLATTVDNFVDANERFVGNLGLDYDDTGTPLLLGSRCDVLFWGQSNEQRVVDAMQTVRGSLERIGEKYGVASTVHTYMFIFTEMDAIVVEEAVRSLGFCMLLLARLTRSYMAGTKHGTGSMWSRGDVLDLPGHRWFRAIGHAHDSNDRYCPARVRQEPAHTRPHCSRVWRWPSRSTLTFG